MRKRIEQRKIDEKFGRMNKAIAKHVEECVQSPNRLRQNNLLGKREEALPKEDFRKHLYKGEQKKVHEFK